MTTSSADTGSGRSFLPVSEARAAIFDKLQPIAGWERVAVRGALGRVLAEDIIAPYNVPAHDNSAMDGYAFAGSQLVPGQPLTLRSVGTALAGKAWTGTVNAGECVKIMTGAIMPAGLDTVVPQEFTTAQGDQIITVACRHIDIVQHGNDRQATFLT